MGLRVLTSMAKRSYQVEYAVTETIERDRNQPLTFFGYSCHSAHGDLDKALKELKRALKLPGASQYCWRVSNSDTGIVLWRSGV